ncbi:hypothetical protein Ddye_019244 [Dipteronia dyeriana]|uniref:DUF8040 domain-containing protein n=1 Tax=Dipteronia dyeriana TaxID=168575 RepID=A0AAD9TXF4_9ROSI|nr:hypothetical protein Ddye_019244 [Dipteronia dyeriana]
MLPAPSAAHVIFFLQSQVYLFEYERRRSERRNLGHKTFSRLQIRSIEIQRITRASDTNCIWELRMDRNTFAILCELLKTRGGLLDDGNVTIEKQVATFVHILAHHVKNKSIQVRFYRSGETISRHVHRVLLALLRLEDVLFVKPTPVPDDCTDSRWRWFKGCIGALDGTYIEMTVPDSDKPRYRTRKGHIATNVLSEGSATDSRVLRDGITRQNGLKVSYGNYYLADAGYTNGQGFLAPYRGTRMYMDVDPEEYTPITLEELPIGEGIPNELESIDVVEANEEWSQ